MSPVDTINRLIDQTTTIRDSLTTFKSKIDVKKNTFDSAQVKQQVDLNTKKNDKKIYDSKFLEEQFPYQSKSKKRRQTLQEFVLLFFYISLAIFCIAMMINAYLENGQDYWAAVKVLGLFVVIAVAITAILIRVG
jgi:uncharacterized membrane protein YcjF (UPF0283 family)